MSEFKFTLKYKVTGKYNIDYIIERLYSYVPLDIIVGIGVDGIISIDIIAFGGSKQEVIDTAHKTIIGMELGLEIIV